jgi:hypothetical protein
MTRYAAPFLGSGQIDKLGKTGSVVATGGEIRDFWHNGIYWRAHLFLTSGTLTVTNGGEIEYLIVGGGGGGGMDMGGGGGGGGVLTGKTVINQGGHAVVVGAGGIGGPRAGTGTGSQGRSAHQYTLSATSGGNSTFLGIAALGGGYGGSSYFQYTPNNGFGANGACGGGASGYSDGNTGRGGTGSQGFNGGGASGQYYSGGGGGAGQAGGSGTSSGAAKGGDGRMVDILGIQLWWGAGGGGSGYTTNGGNGGRGGGGGGAVGVTLGGQDAFNAGMPGGVGSTNSQTNTPGGHAGQNTGSGGGGGSHYSANNSGGNGGSGIVVVRYPLSPGFESPGNVIYEPLSLVAQGSGGVTITGNGTTAASFFKTSGTSAWDTQVYSLQPFTAPVTLEFNKLASPDFGDNGLSYAMIGWNADPTTNASYSSLDWAAYPYSMNTYQVYHNNSLVQNGGTWSSSQKFYIVYDTDGWIRHYNGSTLLYQVSTGVGRTVYLDSSLNRVNGGYGGFSNARITKNAWNGTRYVTRSTPSTTPRDGLVLHLDSGNPASYSGSGTSWFDLSPSRVTATLSNTTFSTDNGGVLVFNGSNSGSSLPGANLSLTNMTISTWCFSANYNQNGFLFEKTTNGNVNTQYSLFFQTTNTVIFRTQGLSTTDLTVANSTAGISNNNWYNIVATYDGSVKRIYVNGTQVASQNITGTVTQNNTGLAYVGIYGNFAGYPFNGRMSQTQIYSRALSAAEISQNFNATRGRFGV